MNDNEIIAYLIEFGADDWIMLHDVVWESTEGNITPETKTRLKRVLLRLFTGDSMVPGDLGVTGFEEWSGTPEDWMTKALEVLEATNWQPRGSGFWLRLADTGEQIAPQPT